MKKKRIINHTRLSEMLCLYRIINKHTLRDMATLTGLSAATLMRIEQGRNMDSSTLMILLNWMMKSEKEGKE